MSLIDPSTPLRVDFFYDKFSESKPSARSPPCRSDPARRQKAGGGISRARIV